jgi:hypothetical protein
MANGNGVTILRKLGPIGGVLIVAVLATLWVVSNIYAAESKAEKANIRLDGVEYRLKSIEKKIDILIFRGEK